MRFVYKPLVGGGHTSMSVQPGQNLTALLKQGWSTEPPAAPAPVAETPVVAPEPEPVPDAPRRGRKKATVN